jgi:Ni,Fe-hydrogenase III component G
VYEIVRMNDEDIRRLLLNWPDGTVPLHEEISNIESAPLHLKAGIETT